MCRRQYFMILLIPLSFIDTAKLQRKTEIYKYSPLINVN